MVVAYFGTPQAEGPDDLGLWMSGGTCNSESELRDRTISLDSASFALGMHPKPNCSPQGEEAAASVASEYPHKERNGMHTQLARLSVPEGEQGIQHV